MKPYYEGLIHRPSYKTSAFDSLSPSTKTQNKTPPLLSRPSNHKLSRRKKGNSSESRGNGTREPRWSWTGKREENDYKTRTQTLKGTRVTSSNGDNYIILSPVNPGNQVNIQLISYAYSKTLQCFYKLFSLICAHAVAIFLKF